MTDDPDSNKPRNRRITVEVPMALYARLTVTKLYTGKTLNTLGGEAFEMIAEHYGDLRKNSRKPE